MIWRTPRSIYKTILIILRFFVSFRINLITLKTRVIIAKANVNHNTIFSRVSLIITSFELTPLVNVRLTHYYIIFSTRYLSYGVYYRPAFLNILVHISLVGTTFAFGIKPSSTQETCFKLIFPEYSLLYSELSFSKEFFTLLKPLK